MSPSREVRILTRIDQILQAARVPETLLAQQVGDWHICRRSLPSSVRGRFPEWETYTLLLRKVKADISDIHLADDQGFIEDVVMEDSQSELQRHLPIWLEAKGKILVSGLGLGCVVRGLLINPAVTQIDVIEIDEGLISVVGAEFRNDPLVRMHHADAIQFATNDRWDFAWHDIWTPRNEGLQVEHARLMVHFRLKADRQGAWMFPRAFRHRYSEHMSMVGIR